MKKNENIDRYGHCIFCHRNLIVQRVIDNKVTFIFLPDKDSTQFLLDDGSKCDVCICKTCKKDIDFSDDKVKEQVMEAIINGWEKEVADSVADESKKKWTPEFGKQYLDTYRQRKIILHSDSVDKVFLEKRIRKIREERGQVIGTR